MKTSIRQPRSLARPGLRAVLLLAAASVTAEPVRVDLWRTPDGGIQPQAATDSRGVIHLIFFKGDPRAGDIFYTRREPGQDSFRAPLQVNHQAGAAVAAGTIRGAQLALGKNGRVHVVWNGSRNVSPTNHHAAPLLYTRLNDAGTAFEPERNIITYAYGLDGGSSVAADPQGNVYVTWHGAPPGNTQGEQGRAIFLARSQDEGRTFRREEPVHAEPTGACACCGMRAFADSRGAVYISYRGATDKVTRDNYLLVAPKDATGFKIAGKHPWTVNACPMSSTTLTESPVGALATWETAGQVCFGTIDLETLQVSPFVTPPGNTGKRKHPVAVANRQGRILLAWAEGTGWQKGGALAWQVFDRDGKPTEAKGRADGIPVWGLPTGCVQADDSFAVIY